MPRQDKRTIVNGWKLGGWEPVHGYLTIEVDRRISHLFIIAYLSAVPLRGICVLHISTQAASSNDKSLLVISLCK